MEINTKLAEAKWVKYNDDEEVEFKLRPFPMSQGMWIPDTSDDITDYTWKKFNYCVLDWKGLNDQDGTPLECTEENKQYIFDYVHEIMLWVSVQIASLTTDISLEKKT